MNKIILTLLLGITTFSYAQQGKWTVELSSGFRSEIFESSVRYAHYRYKTGNRLSTPQIEATIWYGLTNHFAIESGLSYVEYSTNWTVQYYGFIHRHKMYSALQIPLRTRFSVPIAKSNFCFFTSTGIVFQFPLQKRVSYMDTWMGRGSQFDGILESKITEHPIEYTLSAYSPLHSFNILLNARIGFVYQFDFGVGISVFGEYYKGTRTMSDIFSQYNGGCTERYVTYNTKGDYWNTGIGISYSFKNTCKKNKE